MSACQGCGTEIPPSRGGQPRKWCSDRCRRHTLYSQPCLDCGTLTYDGSAHPPERCVPCTARTRIIWTEEAVMGAFHEWARRYGSAPGACDWNPQQAGARGWSERAARFYDDGVYPHTNTVQRVYGSWSAGITAAGLTPRPQGRPRKATVA